MITMQQFYRMFGVLCALLASGARIDAAKSARPNVLFVVADDLRTNLGCYGDPAAKTPNLDRLAGRGLLFERAYAQQSLCNPSRASAMTGRRPDTLRVWDLRTHFRETIPDVVTLPQMFRASGYFAQAIGKVYHNGDTKIHGDPASWSVPETLGWGSHGRDLAQVPENTAPSAPLSVSRSESRDVADEAYLDGRVARSAIEALRGFATKRESFFLAVGFWKPHRPFNAPRRYWDMYRREDLPLAVPATAPADAPASAVESQHPDYVEAARDPAAAAELRHGYYACTSFLDAQVGRVVDELDRLGLAQNTIIVFWSDHGFQLGEHGSWGKTSCYEQDARVPLLIVPPGGLVVGKRTAALVELIDLYPTLAELAGLPVEAGLEGKSFAKLFTQPSADMKAVAFTQNPRPWNMRPGIVPPVADLMGCSARTANWRYTEWRTWDTGKVVGREFYDEHADPVEAYNLVADPTRAPDVKKMATLLARQFGEPDHPTKWIKSP